MKNLSIAISDFENSKKHAFFGKKRVFHFFAIFSKTSRAIWFFSTPIDSADNFGHFLYEFFTKKFPIEFLRGDL